MEKKKKQWPGNCVWPKPLKDGEGDYWNFDDVDPTETDETVNDLVEIKDYIEELVEEGILDEDYTLIDRDIDSFEPEKGEDYWNGEEGFMMDMLEEDLADRMNLLKLPVLENDAVIEIRKIIHYDFSNENLLRQAFTRRSFQVEYSLEGCCEELEFLGDSVLNSIVTKEIMDHFGDVWEEHTEAPYRMRDESIHEGELSKIRSRMIDREHLSKRAVELGLNKFILYGKTEQESEAALEDMMEALVGAVVIDSGWDMSAVSKVVDELVCIQLNSIYNLLAESRFDALNAWHQRHFGKMPEYEVYGSTLSKTECKCILRFLVPENDKDIWPDQIVTAEAESRSKARERAAEKAFSLLVSNGLWINLKEADIEPDLNNSINQLQELYQKKYIPEQPEYTFREWRKDEWLCLCEAGGVNAEGLAGNKTQAKKLAAYRVIVYLLESAGIKVENRQDPETDFYIA